MKLKITLTVAAFVLGVIIAPLFPLILAAFCYNETEKEKIK